METRVSPETELLALARHLDSRALAQVYDQYSPELYRYAMRLLGDTSLAEDCVAETFHRFLQAISHGAGPREYVRAYLYQIAHNWITDQFRRNHPGVELTDNMVEFGESLEETSEQHFLRSQVRLALRQLTPDQRQVIVLKYWEDWENEEVARALNKPVGAVKSLQHRALAALQRHMEKEMA
jgi:RNA polymerase sigma-70 factor (ECF subfamily)